MTATRLSRSGLDALYTRIEHEVAADLVTSAQIAIAVGGEVVAQRSFGGADDESRFCIFSATKTITATALLPHLADGSVELTAPVRSYVPEFATNGLHDCTVLQLLTMQGGFPQAGMSRRAWGTRDGRRQQFAEWRPEFRPGMRTEYHPSSAHWVIAEILEAVGGRPYVDLVHERVVAPSGAAPLLGPASVASRAPHTVRSIGTFPADRADLVAVFGREDLLPEAVISHEAVLGMNDPRSWEVAIPGGGGITTAHDLALVYQHLLHNREGALPDEWLADATTVIRNASVSVSDKVPANRTLIAYVSGLDGWHDHRWLPVAPRTFGHAGMGGQLAWADPDSGLSFAFVHDTLNVDPRVEYLRARDLHRLVTAALEG
ncbi:MAG: serine hydrolase domain-containing protein [Ilumatobacteraceae bacterium]